MDDESFMEIDSFENKIWKNKRGLRHRLDGPAVICNHGTKEWWQNGELHRLDGPAKQWPSGKKEWYKSGKRFKSKDTFFRALSKKEKELALFSEDFLNG